MQIIKCENITLSYNKEKIVKDLSFDVIDGEYICIIGENGTGKSTLVKAILGLVNPENGKIKYSGVKQNEIGYISQTSAIADNFPASVYEIVLSGCLNRKVFMPFYSKKDKEKADYYINHLELDTIKKKTFSSLSGGQKQRVLLARALCATKKVLLLDEPTASLDPVATKEFYEIIYDLNKQHNITIITVSHDIDNSLKYADRIINLSKDSFKIYRPDELITKGEKNNV